MLENIDCREIERKVRMREGERERGRGKEREGEIGEEERVREWMGEMERTGRKTERYLYQNNFSISLEYIYAILL